MSHSPVYITSMECVTACGLDLASTWQALGAQQSGIDEHLKAALKDFNLKKSLPDRKLLKLISRIDAIGLMCAYKAIDSSGIPEYQNSCDDLESFNNQTGVYIGAPGNKYSQQYDFMPAFKQANGDTKIFGTSLFDHVHPMWLLRILPNNVLAYTGIRYGFKGANQNITNHGVSSLQALIEAYLMIQSGQLERAVVVAYDSALEPQSVKYYDDLGVLSKTGLAPYDQNANGTVLGEGAACIVLESEKSVAARNAKPLGEMKAGASCGEAESIFAVNKQGRGIERVIDTCLQHAALTPSDIGMICGHGNGNLASDKSEAAVFSHYFKNYATPLTSFKWATGHTITTAGLIDTVLSLQALRDQAIPGIKTLQTPLDELNGLSLSSDMQHPISNQALIINRGFGSLNAAVIIKACND